MPRNDFLPQARHRPWFLGIALLFVLGGAGPGPLGPYPTTTGQAVVYAHGVGCVRQKHP